MDSNLAIMTRNKYLLTVRYSPINLVLYDDLTFLFQRLSHYHRDEWSSTKSLWIWYFM